ncbi:Lysine-specific demethylase 8 [Trichinella spiralis]|uniref:Lysine-specific demethylase 8 n=1 Tax=Trichinella spiralis TaxID=6334 RepID=A0A0V1BXB2_TRISP|nr:Lysine-specific demethylase 8 [Trichinella spiralis]
MILLVRIGLALLQCCFGYTWSILECFFKKPKSVTDKVIVITGAARGIGKGLALLLAHLHAKIVLVDLDESTNKQTAEELRQETSACVYAYTADVTDPESMRQVATAIVTNPELGCPDVLVCSAGVLIPKLLEDHSDVEIYRTMNVNVLGYFWTIRAFYPYILKRGQGHIVAVSSYGGHFGNSYSCCYSASKFAVRGLMESLEWEIYDHGFGGEIKTTTIYPFFTRTDLLSSCNVTSDVIPVLTPEETSQGILKAILYEQTEAFIPFYGSLICYFFKGRTFKAIELKDFEATVEICNFMLNFIWERLNTGHWSEVNISWRLLYTMVSLLLSIAHIANGRLKDALCSCDKGLLLGCPISGNVLARLASLLHCKMIDTYPLEDMLINDKFDQALASVNDVCEHFEHCVPRVACPSLETFQRDFLIPQNPVVIEGALESWQAMEKWNIAYLMSKCAYRTVPIEIGSKYTNDEWSQKLLTITDFVHEYFNPDAREKAYLAQHQLFEQITELKDDIAVPDYCCLQCAPEDVDINAWFGPANTVSPLHTDPRDNLFAQVFGKKYLRLCHPTATKNLYPITDGLMSNTSQIDMEKIDYEKFPLVKNVKFYETIVKPGDLLFIPKATGIACDVMSSAGSAAVQSSLASGLLPSPSNLYYQSLGHITGGEGISRNGSRTPVSQRRVGHFTRARHHSSCDVHSLCDGVTFERCFDSQLPPADPQIHAGGLKGGFPFSARSSSNSYRQPTLSSHLSHGNLGYLQSDCDWSADLDPLVKSGRGSNEAPGCGSGSKIVNGRMTTTNCCPADCDALREDLRVAMEKLNATMGSIKSFWSPELKRERALRKEETAKMNMLQEQLKLSLVNNQKQSVLIEQLQNELRFQCNSGRSRRFPDDGPLIGHDDYRTVCQERDMYRRDWLISSDAVKELQYQLESQRQLLLSKDESVKRLLEALHSKGVPASVAQSCAEMELAQNRIVELEEKCSRLQAHCDDLESHLQQSHDGLSNLRKDAVIESLQDEVASYEAELKRLRSGGAIHEREFTDKMVTDKEYQELKLKADKLELELGQKTVEIQALYTRLSTAEESASDFKKHLELMKESNASKDQQATLLQSDIDALRGKLESKNEMIDQKAQQITELQADKNRLLSELNLLNEQHRISEVGLSTKDRKIDLLEETIRERDCELNLIRTRLNSSPGVIQEKKLQDEINRLVQERDLWRKRFNEEHECLAIERKRDGEAHEKENKDLRIAIASLQKEISDRQVFIESQNEKINDMVRQTEALTKENSLYKELNKTNGVDLLKAEIERLNQAVDESRSEVDRLLKIIHNSEKEKNEGRESGNDSKRFHSNTENADYQSVLMHKDRRIEELEEALKESVSITAEREMAVAQQKLNSQRAEQRIAALKDELKTLQEQYDELSIQLKQLRQEKVQSDATIKTMQEERKRYVDEVMQLKGEVLLAAIEEKDAHIAFLENFHGRKSSEEIDNVKKQKEELLQRLKEENARRVKLHNDPTLNFTDHFPKVSGIDLVVILFIIYLLLILFYCLFFKQIVFRMTKEMVFGLSC